MKIREINLEQGVNEIITEIEATKDLMLLSHAYDQEKSKGNRPLVLGALEARRNATMSHGAGAEDATGMEDAFRPYQTGKPQLVVDHDFGAGAEAKQTLTEEQRLTMKLRNEEVVRRSSDLNSLSQFLVDKKGNRTATWGTITVPQKEIPASKEDKTNHIPYRPSKVFLKFCPRCGKRNQHEHGADGVCYHCNLNMVDVVRKMMDEYPERFKGVELPNPDFDGAA